MRTKSKWLLGRGRAHLTAPGSEAIRVPWPLVSHRTLLLVLSATLAFFVTAITNMLVVPLHQTQLLEPCLFNANAATNCNFLISNSSATLYIMKRDREKDREQGWIETTKNARMIE